MPGFSYMAPCLSLVTPQDLILTRLLLAIFPNSFGKKICRYVLQNSVDMVYMYMVVLMLAEQIYYL